MPKLFMVILVCLTMAVSSLGNAVPPTPPPALSQSMDHFYNGHIEDGYRIINGYIRENPEDPMGYFIRGTGGEWEQKLRNLRGKIDKKIIDDYQAANQLAFQAYSRDPHNVDTLIALGNSYMRLGKKWGDVGKWMRAALISKKSHKHLQKAIEQDPERWDAYFSLGAFHYFAANLPGGAKPFASLLGIKGDRQQGIKEITSGATHPNLLQADAIYLLKYVYRKEDAYDRVFTLLQDLHRRYPDNAEIAYEIAVTYGDLKQPKKGIDYLTAFLNTCDIAERTNATCHDRYRFLSLELMGNFHRDLGNTQAALVAYQQSASITAYPSESNYARLLYRLAETYETLGKTDPAKQTYTDILALKNKDTKPWRTKAQDRLNALTPPTTTTL